MTLDRYFKKKLSFQIQIVSNSHPTLIASMNHEQSHEVEVGYSGSYGINTGT